MNLLSIGKFAKQVGVTPTTLRRMHETGELVPCHISAGGTRYYSTEQLEIFLGKRLKNEKIVGYCRVSTIDEEEYLKKQVECVKTYMYAKGYQFEIIEDIGSGIDFNKKGLRDLLMRINNHEVSKIVLLSKDRLLTFGFEMFAYICQINGVKIEIIDNTECKEDKEIIDDLIHIITIFFSRLYGEKSDKTKCIINGVKENVDR